MSSLLNGHILFIRSTRCPGSWTCTKKKPASSLSNPANIGLADKGDDAHLGMADRAAGTLHRCALAPYSLPGHPPGARPPYHGASPRHRHSPQPSGWSPGHGPCQISDMSAVEDVKAVIGEHQWSRQVGKPAGQCRRCAALVLKVHGVVAGLCCGAALGGSRRRASASLITSKTRTTFSTPPLVRATSTATADSRCVTCPIR